MTTMTDIMGMLQTPEGLNAVSTELAKQFPPPSMEAAMQGFAGGGAGMQASQGFDPASIMAAGPKPTPDMVGQGMAKQAANVNKLQKEFRAMQIEAQTGNGTPMTWEQFLESKGYRPGAASLPVKK